MLAMRSEFMLGRKWFVTMVMCVSVHMLFGTSEFGHQPSGLSGSSETPAAAAVFYAESEITSTASSAIVQHEVIEEIISADGEKDTVKKEEEPKLEPMVLAGTGAVAVGTGLAVAGAFGTPVLLLIAALCFAGGAWLTAIGWRRIKDEPKKFKGEKFAIANYIVIGVIGVAASFYSLYVLFSV